MGSPLYSESRKKPYFWVVQVTSDDPHKLNEAIGLYASAAALYGASRCEAALALIEPLLTGPRPDARILNLAAACCFSMRRLHDAEAHWRRAIEVDPGSCDAHNNLGALLQEVGRLTEAEACYRRALSIAPDRAGIHANLARVQALLGRPVKNGAAMSEGHDDAFAHHRVLGREPTDEARIEAAVAFYKGGHYAEGLAILQPMIASGHPSAQTLNLAGGLSFACGHWSDAEVYLRRAVAMERGHCNAHNNLGVVLEKLGRWEEAERAYRDALAIEPRHAGAQFALACLFKVQARWAEAEQACRALLEFRPDDAQAHNVLGAALQALGRMDEASAHWREALAIRPDFAEASFNLGIAMQTRMRDSEAEQLYRHCLKHAPGDLEAQFNLAHVLLRTGQFAEGWALYERRLERAAVVLPFAQWRGEPLAGKSISVWAEQGYGDSLQFCRYLPMLKRLGAAKVTVVVQPGLRRLFERIDGVDACIEMSGQAVAHHDYGCAMLSLPHWMGTTLETIPASMPYLDVPRACRTQWRGRLPHGRKIGLVWAGDPRAHDLLLNRVDRRRSLAASAFLPLLRVPGVTFVSLQKGETTQPQIETLPAALRPFDPMHDVRDFADTAAIVEQLDLVITVDTSVAHLAGALDKPVWLLSRYNGCWRWMLDRDDTPWYPRTRLFRQAQPEDWAEVVERVRLALEAWLASEREPSGPTPSFDLGDR